MDPELKAMSTIQRALVELAPGPRERVLAWLKIKTEEGAFNGAQQERKPRKANGTAETGEVQQAASN